MKPVAAAIAALVFALPATAAQAPTLEANPPTVGMLSQVALSGTTGTAKAGQTVYVEAKECDATHYRVVAAATSGAGGSWTASTSALVTTRYRARVGRAYSRPAVVRKRAVLALNKLPNGRIFMVKGFGAQLVRRKVRIERYTASGWVLVQRATFRQSDIFGVVETTVRIRRKGLRLRAFVPLSSARPCFVAGASPIVRS